MALAERDIQHVTLPAWQPVRVLPKDWAWASPPPYELVSLLDMLPVDLKEFLVMFAVIENMMTECSTREYPAKLDTVIPDSDFRRARLRIRRLKEQCKTLGLDTSAELIENTLRTYMPDNQVTSYGVLRMSLDSIVRTIYAELQQVMLLHVPKGQTEYYEKPALFGQAVADNFPDAAHDIGEAGNCYATDRHTACVMHLMRALEVALDAVGRGIGLSTVVVDARHSWTAALKNIFNQIGANDKAGDPTWTTQKSDFFKDVQSLLFAVKVSWRDTSMHLDKIYTPQHAKRIYDAVKNFYEHLAEHLDQSGNFTP